MSNKPMTDYLEDKYGRERSLTETLNSVNIILNRLSVVEAEVAQIRRHCNSVGWHLTQSPQSLSVAEEWCDCSSCTAPCASPSPHESTPAPLPSPAERG